MRFDLTEEQAMLKKTTRDFAAGCFPDHVLASVAAEPASEERIAAWKEMHQLGLVSILVPEEAGGAGGSVTDACVIAEALGEVTAPVPYLGSAIAAPLLLRVANARSELEELAAGATWSPLLARDLSWPTSEVAVAWDWIPGARGVVLDSGNRAVTLPLDEPDFVDPSIDPLHPLALATIATSAPLIGEGLRRARATVWVAQAAFALGLAGSALDTATDYAKEREQYGVPIGTFQAVQHMCADMLVAVESSRSIVYGASWTVDHAEVERAERIAAAALVWAGTAAVRVCETAIQVLGGVGITEEHVAHRRLRSARLLSQAFGGTRAARSHIAQHRITASSQEGAWT